MILVKLFISGDPDPNEIAISSEFVFIICCTSASDVPKYLKDVMHVIEVQDNKSNSDETNQNEAEGDPAMDQIAAMYGAKEIVRYT